MKKFLITTLCITLMLSAININVYADTNKNSKYFSDLYNYQWAIDAIDYLYEIGLVSGTVAPDEYNKGKFDPSSKVTKAEFSQIIYNLTGKNYNHSILPADVMKNAWYYDSVVSEFNHGILEIDYLFDKVYPDSYLSREECFCMLYRVLTREFHVNIPIENNIKNFDDYRSVSTIYYSMVDALVSNGYVSGSSNSINPKAFLTRAEMATLIHNVIKKLELKFEKVDVVIPIDLDTRIKNYLTSKITDREIHMIAAVIDNEIGSGFKVEKQAIAWEILNRLDATGYGMGGSVTNVLTCPNQYLSSSASNYGNGTDESYKIAKDICLMWAKEKLCGLYPIDGRVLPSDYKWHNGGHGCNGSHGYCRHNWFWNGGNQGKGTPIKFYWTKDGGYMATASRNSQSEPEIVETVCNLSDADINLLANVAMHEVGCINGNGVKVTITYSDGTIKTYNDATILYKYHARSVVNQYLSSDPYFPDSISGCISKCWAKSLTNQNAYSHDDAIWKQCRECAVESLSSNFYFPSGVYAATQDSNFYPSTYYKYATVRWSTPWNSGTFYYYSHK